MIKFGYNFSFDAHFTNLLSLPFMSLTMMAYTKSILERVSFDPILFCKELEKALKMLLPYEIEQLTDWLVNFTQEKPELRQCLAYIK